MKTLLDLGYELDYNGEPSEVMVPMDYLIPENHDHFFSLLRKEDNVKDTEKAIKTYVEVGQKSRDVAAGILMLIRDLHPYFTITQNAEYLLNSSVYHLLKHEGNRPEDFLNLFVKTSSFNKDDLSDSCSGMTIFDVEDLISDLKDRVTLILDDTNSALASLSSAQRNSLYTLSKGSTETAATILSIPVSFRLSGNTGMRGFSAAMDFDETLAEKFHSAVRALSDNKAEELPEVIQSAVSYVSEDTTDASMIYSIPSLSALLDLEFFQMLEHNERVHTCPVCGKKFPVVTEGQTACNFTLRKSETGTRTCEEYNQYMNQGKKDHREMVEARKRAYKTHYARLKKGDETEEDMENWKRKAAALKEKVQAGKITKEEYLKRISAVQG